MIAGISGGLSQMSDNLQPDPYTASLSISRLQGRDVDTSTLIWECCQSTGGRAQAAARLHGREGSQLPYSFWRERLQLRDRESAELWALFDSAFKTPSSRPLRRASKGLHEPREIVLGLEGGRITSGFDGDRRKTRISDHNCSSQM